MLRILFAGQVPKDSEYPELIEDALLFGVDRKSAVISDGASESYDSKKWADLIVQKYTKDSLISKEWFFELQDNYHSSIDFQNLSWSKQASFERGSFATLLGLKELSLGQIEITAIGDCECFVLEKDLNIKAAIPYEHSLDFENRPQLISTRSEFNSFLEKNPLTQVVTIDNEDTILLMSDALACWTLRSMEEDDDKWKLLLSISNEIELSELITSERSKRSMKVDDVTFVKLQITETAT